ncbi:hypothetical protein [Aeromonas phage Asp37]|nr:hypothetical protein [Aeromonas phage Asp37]
MKFKSIVAAVVLSAMSLPALAGWDVRADDQMVASRQYSADGSSSVVTVHMGGGFMIGTYPADWDGTGSDREIGRADTTITVNGQPVRFLVTMEEDGAIYLWAKTYQGQQFIKNELWSKARVTFVNNKGSRFVLPAKGFQKAWDTMKFGQGI